MTERTEHRLPPSDIPSRDRPLVVQSDGTLMLDVGGPFSAIARDCLSSFSELERSPEYVHTYRITPLALWNAAAAGVDDEWIEQVLSRLSRYPVPPLVLADIREQMGRFGRVRLAPFDDDFIEARIEEEKVRLELERRERLVPFWVKGKSGELLVRKRDRGAIKQGLIREGYPAEDLCGYVDGRPISFELARAESPGGAAFSLRPYQVDAVSAFHEGGGPKGGAGVIVLPCGAGKTIVGIGAMLKLQTATLILTTNTVAVHQWRSELLAKTDIPDDIIGEYTGAAKQIRPITITTYQMLTHRAGKNEPFKHLDLLKRSEWGLIIYDEVHLLPAPVFRATAEIQVRRRLGLTATLIREDGREHDVFALIGPLRYGLFWRVLEEQGYIAEAMCCEVRLPLPDDRLMAYAVAPKRHQFRLAAENPRKVRLVAELIETNPDDQILVIGQYIDQLEQLATCLDLPLITGQTKTAERERLYEAFKKGHLRVLVVSKVANFAIDLPDASMAIQISGTYGSRQEEAQRLGRILRPKSRTSRFYTLVSNDTREQEFAWKRQRFLVEQGYRYQIVHWQSPSDDIDEMGRASGARPQIEIPLQGGASGYSGSSEGKG
jgi:DNA excision repair protein ERCC-3